jgi:hypothetical protein
MSKNLTDDEMMAAWAKRITDWRDLKPGMYRYFYARSRDYRDIAVFGVTPDNQYEYTTLDSKCRMMDRPLTASLADAGVKRLSKDDRWLPNYLGINYIVPLADAGGF